ncbi:BnaCnng12320D [Brassica napus]|uniref:BnaCnng12320D protein n=1 Tax=Brassica napus TaxID=3708 RepID=A0A078I4Q8_BRANA|nr:BnaCnng12320D [Brassica napus]
MLSLLPRLVKLGNVNAHVSVQLAFWFTSAFTEQEAEIGRGTSSVSGRFSRNRDLYLFLPLLFSDQESSDGDHNVASWRERIILVNPFTQGLIVLEESSGLNPLLRDLLESREEGHPPASKASIDAMRVVDTDGWGGEYEMPVEGDEVERKRSDGGEIWVMFGRSSSGHDGGNSDGNTAGSGGT